MRLAIIIVFILITTFLIFLIMSLFSYVNVGNDTPQTQPKLIQIHVPTEDFITVRADAKPLLKKAVQKLEVIIYDQATIHNPEGDQLPDEIDDAAKNFIKTRLQ